MNEHRTSSGAKDIHSLVELLDDEVVVTTLLSFMIVTCDGI